MHADVIRALVERLEERIKSRTPFQLYRVDDRPLTLDEAYAVQAEFVRRALRAGGDSLAGYKVGLTAEKLQKLCGVNEPVAGRILKSGVHASGIKLRKADFQRPGIESELALRIGKPVPADGNRDELIDCIDAVAAAFEIIDDRGADYARLEASSIVAENSWNKAIVLGDAMPLSVVGDFNTLQGQLHINDAPAASGVSGDVAGGPLGSLAWMARFAHEAGHTLLPGQWLMTGAIIPPKFPVEGDAYSFRLGALPPVAVTIV